MMSRIKVVRRGTEDIGRLKVLKNFKEARKKNEWRSDSPFSTVTGSIVANGSRHFQFVFFFELSR